MCDDVLLLLLKHCDAGEEVAKETRRLGNELNSIK